MRPFKDGVAWKKHTTLWGVTQTWPQEGMSAEEFTKPTPDL